MTRPQRRYLAAALAVLTCTAWHLAMPATAPARQPRAQHLTTVYASSEMSPDCQRATTVAVEHLNALGGELELVFADLDHVAFWAQRHGEVTVHDGMPTRPGDLAETTVVRSEDGDVLSADVSVGLCTPSVVAHELAHLVGLEQAVDHEALMHADGR
jgi:hypothetical protein